jgi:hypothetical protein
MLALSRSLCGYWGFVLRPTNIYPSGIKSELSSVMACMSKKENIRHRVVSAMLMILALAIFCGIMVVGAPHLFFG